jgi:ELWxxDGT repeat protein
MDTFATDIVPGARRFLRGVRYIGLIGLGFLLLTASSCRKDALFFSANDGVTGWELWRTNGTDASTVLVKDIRPGAESSFPGAFTVLNGRRYFFADNGLWRTDGTEAGTVLVKPVILTSRVAVFNGAMYFAGTDDGVGTERRGRELWKSDGTAAGTVVLKDIRGGAESSDPGDFTIANGILFFTAETASEGRELWKSDGTEAGTVIVKNINPVERVSRLDFPSPTNLTAFNDLLYFNANDGPGGHGTELWKSDGTEAGTVLVKDIWPGVNPVSVPFSSTPTFLTVSGGVLYFTAFDDVGHNGLWKSDGTEAGTVFVKEVLAPNGLTAANDILYFINNDRVHGAELWKSDGTEAGTVLVKDVNPGAAPSDPLGLTVFNGAIYFSADDGVSGREFWKSDGTEAGTAMVKDINPGAGSSRPELFRVFHGVLYFRADDGAHGIELWKTNGTEAGTVMVKDICTGTCDSSPFL